jgi:hypothetical protein
MRRAWVALAFCGLFLLGWRLVARFVPVPHAPTGTDAAPTS